MHCFPCLPGTRREQNVCTMKMYEIYIFDLLLCPADLFISRILFYFQDRVLLGGPGWPGIHGVK